jgi:hypothetical protein
MKIFTTRRGVLIGGLTAAALPGVAHAAHVFRKADVAIPMAQLSRSSIKIEGFDAKGGRRAGQGHFCDLAGAGQKMAIVADRELIENASKVVLTIAFPKGVLALRKTARVEVSGAALKQMEDAGTDRAIVAIADWRQSGNDWHLQVA